MTHYTFEQWLSYIKGDEIDRQPMDDHLYDCNDCMETYLLATEQLAKILPPMQMDVQEFTKKIYSDIQAVSNQVEQTRAHTHSKFIEKHKSNHWYTNVIFHYTIAASITIILMSSGLFQQMFNQVSDISRDAEVRQNITVR